MIPSVPAGSDATLKVAPVPSLFTTGRLRTRGEELTVRKSPLRTVMPSIATDDSQRHEATGDIRSARLNQEMAPTSGVPGVGVLISLGRRLQLRREVGRPWTAPSTELSDRRGIQRFRREGHRSPSTPLAAPARSAGSFARRFLSFRAPPTYTR